MTLQTSSTDGGSGAFLRLEYSDTIVLKNIKYGVPRSTCRLPGGTVNVSTACPAGILSERLGVRKPLGPEGREAVFFVESGKESGMSPGKSPLAVITAHKTAFIAIGVFMLLLELAIFAVAAVRSGDHYRLQFLDVNGNMVYETEGQNLQDFNKYHFEKTHGPVRNYQRRLIKEDVPFPFRAWFVAALGIPLGLVLSFVFILRVYTSIFYGEEQKAEENDTPRSRYETRLERLIGGVQKFNIFVIAAVVFLFVIAYWIIPNLMVYLGEVGVDTVIRFKWVLLLIGLAAFAVLIWIIYLKYLLAKKSMDSQVEVDKYRMELEYKQGSKPQLQLAHEQGSKPGSPLVSWDADEVVDGDHAE